MPRERKLRGAHCRISRNEEGFINEKRGNPVFTEDPISYPYSPKKVGSYYSRPMRCLYVTRERFNDIFLRKFSLFGSLLPRGIVFSEDLRRWADRKEGHTPDGTKGITRNENDLQKYLCCQMKSKAALRLPAGSNNDRSFRVRLLSCEVPTVFGTLRTEILDIPGYDLDDHSLVALEIKGPDANRSERENLFSQGMEHRNLLEKNKMAEAASRKIKSRKPWSTTRLS